MGYEKIDGILNQWAKKHNLPLYKTYKDEQVRSFEVVNTQGKRFQIWIDLPSPKNEVGVHVWDYKKKRKDFLVSPDELIDCLEKAYITAKTWAT